MKKFTKNNKLKLEKQKMKQKNWKKKKIGNKIEQKN